MDKTAVLIIALSARPFIEAAVKAGFKVTAIDGFADAQTLALAEKTITVEFDAQGFKSEALLRAVEQLELHQYLGFVYGSGFDAQPELLQIIATNLPILGNSVETLSAVNSLDFFKVLQKLDITYPPIFHAIPNTSSSNPAKQYLKKHTGGCGGSHIQVISVHEKLSNLQKNKNYIQQYIKGRSVSLLFVARAKTIEIIGFNEQWLNGSASMPFRYGGAVSHIDLPEVVPKQLIQAAEKLTMEFGLLGLNSLDAIIDGEVAYVLEVNPRLSATFDLYEDADLFDRHIEAVLNVDDVEEVGSPQKNPSSKAHAIVYADKNTTVPRDFDWPEWATDTPASQNEAIDIQAEQPICTVTAYGPNAEIAKQLVFARVKMLLTTL